jgi:hypothetical protein
MSFPMIAIRFRLDVERAKSAWFLDDVALAAKQVLDASVFNERGELVRFC